MASTYTTLKMGSTGDKVKELQTLLNGKGYRLAVDGIFGGQTAAAVRDYQSKNSLSVDGIAGDETWGKLTAVASGDGTAGSSASPAVKSALTGVSDATTGRLRGLEAGYTPSSTVSQLGQNAENLRGNAPGEFESGYDREIKDIYDKIMGREDFTYNLNADMLYQQYKDQYTNLGQLAMRDAQGQAASLTGGYGSSYGQAVGQQAYNQYLQELNAIVPDLYNSAYSRYQAEGDELYNQYALASQARSEDYGAYQDALNRYYTDLGLAQDAYDAERNLEYGQYADQLSYWNTKAQQENADYYNQMSLAAASSGGGGGGSSSPNLKKPTYEMLSQALEKFKGGGWDAVASDMDAWELLGYDVWKIEEYLRKQLVDINAEKTRTALEEGTFKGVSASGTNYAVPAYNGTSYISKY